MYIYKVYDYNQQFTYLLTKLIHYEKESIFFDDDAFARFYWRGEGRGSYHWRWYGYDLLWPV